LEYTNEPYAIAKIAGIKMCESYNLQYGTNFIAVMPTNLYGPKDNFHLETSHVLPALIRKMHLGKALEENDWEAIRDDLNRRPIEGLDGSQGKKEILNTLSKYGISICGGIILGGNSNGRWTGICRNMGKRPAAERIFME
jgi:GDP-L-fucose synthase